MAIIVSHGSWLITHGSWLMLITHGSWLMTHHSWLLFLPVCIDDPADQLVADDVSVIQVNEINPRDVIQHRLHMDQTRNLVFRKINLGDIARSREI